MFLGMLLIEREKWKSIVGDLENNFVSKWIIKPKCDGTFYVFFT